MQCKEQANDRGDGESSMTLACSEEVARLVTETGEPNYWLLFDGLWHQVFQEVFQVGGACARPVVHEL